MQGVRTFYGAISTLGPRSWLGVWETRTMPRAAHSALLPTPANSTALAPVQHTQLPSKAALAVASAAQVQVLLNSPAFSVSSSCPGSDDVCGGMCQARHAQPGGKEAAAEWLLPQLQLMATFHSLHLPGAMSNHLWAAKWVEGGWSSTAGQE